MSSPSPPVLQELHRLDRSSSRFHDQITNVLYGKEYMRCVENLQGNDLVWLVDYLDGALGVLDPSSPAFRKCLHKLRSICGTSAILPTSYTISSDLLDVSQDPFASGGYGDVYQGTLEGEKVCIKRVRVYTQDGPQKSNKAFCQEAVMWRRMIHPNVLPLLGITTAPFQLISNWIPGGDLPQYIKKHPDADRLGLLSDIARGLCHLHSCNVIHGDLKGRNVLVDNSGQACIADFGLA
ncbi:kinase-like protein, partial [Thelephora ganbajun]